MLHLPKAERTCIQHDTPRARLGIAADGYGRAGARNDRLAEAVILSTGTSTPPKAIDMPSATPR